MPSAIDGAPTRTSLANLTQVKGNMTLHYGAEYWTLQQGSGNLGTQGEFDFGIVDRIGHHARLEVEEGRSHRAVPHPAQRRGPGGEVAGPEPDEAAVTQGVTAGSGKVGDGVQRFEGHPQVAGGAALGQRVT